MTPMVAFLRSALRSAQSHIHSLSAKPRLHLQAGLITCGTACAYSQEMPSITPSLDELTDPKTFAEFYFAATLLGQGEYGCAFELDDNFVIKVYDTLAKFETISPQYAFDHIVREVAVQQTASQIQTQDGHPCVPPVVSAIQHVSTSGASKPLARFLFYVMPKLLPLQEISANAVAHIIAMSDRLVESGFLHNDIHFGNVMQWGEKPILIDVGLMTQHDPILDEPECSIVKYAQCACLIDCCTRYNNDIDTSALGPVWQRRNAVRDIFIEMEISPWDGEIEPQDEYVARVASQISDKFKKCTLPVKLQLVLAHLSMQFFWSPCQKRLGKQPEICNDCQPIGEAIYAIRNPDERDPDDRSDEKLFKDLICRGLPCNECWK